MTERKRARRVKSNMRSVASVMLLGLVLAGCGVYTLNPSGKSSIKTISVEPFENKTNEFGFTDRLTEIVIDAFIKEGTLRVLPSGKADAALVATLNRYEKVPFKFDLSDQVEEYKVVLGLQVSLRNPKDDSELWTERMTQEGVYNASSETEQDGQQRAGARLVEAILNRTTKSW